MIYDIAETLGKYPHEVMEDLTYQDLTLWAGWLKYKADEQKKAAEKAKRKRK